MSIRGTEIVSNLAIFRCGKWKICSPLTLILAKALVSVVDLSVVAHIEEVANASELEQVTEV